MKTVAIITTRMNSKRLPGKALVDIAGKPLLQHIIDRARNTEVDDVVVAMDAHSFPIAEYCGYHGIPYMMGSQYDVLDRLCQAAKGFSADRIVRLWGDSPLIDPYLIDRALSYDVDYVFTKHYPKGLNFSVIRASALENLVSTMSVTDRAIWNQVNENLIWSMRGYDVLYLNSDEDLSHINLSVDDAESLERVRRIFNGEGDI